LLRPITTSVPSRFVASDARDLITPVGQSINAFYLAPEPKLVRRLAEHARLAPLAQERVRQRAEALVRSVREAKRATHGLDAFLREYHLGSPEGVILMCLAEALLRIPDATTADRLIADKIPSGDWDEHLGSSESLFVNASTWGLMLTGRLVEVERSAVGSVRSWFGRLASRIGEPVARAALRQAMRILGHQFVMGRSIEAALDRSHGKEERAYCYSFDMLGEAALTATDAKRYFEKYREAIAALGASIPHDTHRESLLAHPSISIKLSALHPRYELAQRERVLRELSPRLLALVKLAREHQVGLTVDAEEADRLELSLLLLDAVLQSPLLEGYEGFGLAVQAYQRRAYSVLEWLATRARALKRRITVRLVKGAYWDSEIKRAQERGLTSYPVFTRKASTDISYLACVRLLSGLRDVIYPQFATHNAHTVAYIDEVFRSLHGAFEFQRLHGMGEELYHEVTVRGGEPCRVYAPVGPHEDLLPYLVRRLLENGANTSFVNRIVDENLPVEDVISDPIVQLERYREISHPLIFDPPALYLPERTNSNGVNLADGMDLFTLKRACDEVGHELYRASALIDGHSTKGGAPRVLHNPAHEADAVGEVIEADVTDVEAALRSASAAFPDWESTHAAARADMLVRAADAFELLRNEFVTRLTLEAGKTLPDALAEVREAVDFLRYYSARASQDLSQEEPLPGPTGERNIVRFRGKGVFACISPWNFPLAIFTGQVAAALAAGNTVIAKPAEQTPLTAALAVQLLHEAGIPHPALQFLPGDGATIGAALTRDPRIAGVTFTGSTETARVIERTLSARNAPIATFIAETGGLNAMIVDSSALPEQVVIDAVASAFNSAGQRCSALRVLLVQEEIAPRVIELLAGHMDELRIGDPALLSTDVGPVIDRAALATLDAHAARMKAKALWHHQRTLREELRSGRFFAPLAVELTDLAPLEREAFGPILHIVRYRAADLDRVVDAINAMGYGLTLGIHSRIETVARRIAARARVGNVYVNRNMIGAVVGTQPFGGMGLSGTGPKAGGPHYVQRFATEQTVTVNTAAVGGNATLLSLAES